MPNVLFIDDDAELYSLVKEFFAQTEFNVEYAADADAGFKRLFAKPCACDAVVLDVMLPGADGFEVLRRIRGARETGGLPVIMLTALGEESDRVAGLESGADDYLPKPFSLRELAARLRALLRRGRPASEQEQRPELLRVDDLAIDAASLQVRIGDRSVNLSPLEMRLLEPLATAPGQVISREDLYQRVFGHGALHFDRSLDMAISRLRKKLGPRSDGGERIRAAWGQGYVFLIPGAS